MAQPLSSQLDKVLFGSTTENLLFQAMLPAACCCEMKRGGRGVLRGGRRLFVELEEVVIYLFTNQHTRSLSSSLLTPYWKQSPDMSSVVSEPGGSDWDWRGIGRRLSREQLLWLGN